MDFYYVWKQSSHYLMWKELGKPNAKYHNGKLDQWRAIDEKMGLLRTPAHRQPAVGTGPKRRKLEPYPEEEHRNLFKACPTHEVVRREVPISTPTPAAKVESPSEGAAPAAVNRPSMMGIRTSRRRQAKNELSSPETSASPVADEAASLTLASVSPSPSPSRSPLPWGSQSTTPVLIPTVPKTGPTHAELTTANALSLDSKSTQGDGSAATIKTEASSNARPVPMVVESAST